MKRLPRQCDGCGKTYEPYPTSVRLNVFCVPCLIRGQIERGGSRL